MNYYEELIDSAVNDVFDILELPLEWAHGKITVGDITDQSITSNRKQE